MLNNLLLYNLRDSGSPEQLILPTFGPFPTLLSLILLKVEDQRRLRHMQLLIPILQLKNVVVEKIRVDFGFVLFAHYMSVVVAVILSANSAKRMLFVGPWKDDFRLLLQQLLYVLRMLSEFHI